MILATSTIIRLVGCMGFLLLCCGKMQATHAMGLDLTYRCIGSHQYILTLTFYRDCNGIAAPSMSSVDWNAACGSGTIVLQQTGMREVTPSCPGIIGTACNNGIGMYGIEEYTYSDTLTLPSACTDIRLSHQTCCRNNAITTLVSPGSERLYIEAYIADPTNNNSSPVFTNVPVSFGCEGQPVFYNHGALDVDGDSLTYALTNCRDAANTSVIYNMGYNATNPFSTSTGVDIDTSTGAITFVPNMLQVGVLCVVVQEFRNGSLIGEIVRDIQFTTVKCTNNVPSLSGVNNTNDYVIAARAGSPLCFTLHSNDIDTSQTTSLSWNNSIAGASFTSSGTPYAVGTFCWTPTNSDIGQHIFTATVADNYCPIVGQNSYTYQINVQVDSGNCDSIDLQVISTHSLSCATNDGGAVLLATNGLAPYTYQLVNWTTGDVFTNTTGIFTQLTAGTYDVSVVDSNGCTPACSGHGFVIDSTLVPFSINTTTTNVSCASSGTYNVDSTHHNGSLTATIIGGLAPFLYSIDGINFQQSNFFDSLGAGIYTLIVVDANGCSQVVVDTVQEPQPIQLSVVAYSPTTCGQANASITLGAIGGVGNYNYSLNGNVQQNPTFSGLAAGSYTFRVYDANYCLADTTVTVVPTPTFSTTTKIEEPLCHGNCNGSVSVSIVGGTATSYAITWNTGQTGAAIANLCAGIYTATITDNIGCSDTISIHLTEPAPLIATLVSSRDETCLGNDGRVVLGMAGGTAPYVVNLANLTQAVTYSNQTGNFSGLRGGHYIVNMIDSNGCRLDCALKFVLGGCTMVQHHSTGNGQVLTHRVGSILSVYPNPTSSLVQILYQSQEQGVELAIMDGAGKLVYHRAQLSNKGTVELETNDWAVGTYFVVLRTSSGALIKTKKLLLKD